MWYYNTTKKKNNASFNIGKMYFLNKIAELQKVPEIENGQDVLDDIYNLGKELPKTKFMEWSIRNAK